MLYSSSSCHKLNAELHSTLGSQKKYRTALSLLRIYCHLRHIPLFADLLNEIIKYIVALKDVNDVPQEIKAVVKTSSEVYKSKCTQKSSQFSQVTK